MPGTTANRHYPYPLDSDPMDTAVDIQLLAEAIDTDLLPLLSDSLPGGTVVLTCAAIAPAGWGLFVGQTLANAAIAYPEFWQVAPASWKSGTSLVLPDARNRFAINAGTAALGSVGGANSRAIAIANMPQHSHGALTSLETANHWHSTPDHLHSAGGYAANGVGGHQHTFSQNPTPNLTQGPLLAASAATTFMLGNGGTPQVHATYTQTPNVMDYAGDHWHTIGGWSGPADRALNSGGVSANHQHYITAEGGGQAMDMTPAYVALNYMVRLK